MSPTETFTGSDVLRGQFREFYAIVAVVIGGTLLTGGYGTAIGAVFGALIYGMVQQGIVFAGVDADCIVSEPKVAGTGSASTLCLSREGAVLLGSGALLKAVRYTTKVPASALALPAQPEQ